MAEKRKHKRKINRTQIRFGNETCDKTAFTSNLSKEGFFVRTNRAYPPGTELLFEFHFADGDVVGVKGRVAHASRVPSGITRIRKTGMGIAVDGSQEDYQRMLKALNIIEE